MDELKVLKAISNETRLQILKWLKDPTENFEPQSHSLSTNNFLGGVCVASIKKKVGLSQSTVSIYLSLLHESGLLEAKNIGQWTYYRRNQEAVEKLADWLKFDL
ncbi:MULTISPECIES: metalloregulator ArsR/SmtB family transcription factor [unclassified Paenibacillus]|uniref:ArsR/SmtB family transcription factor n=1 Tax=unclassified Paenibacillus TaxID=185978 RepID=UPI000C272AF1|nr:metalloregulator ArsR/SmtB family transcription factor [Paenibacillus sp. GM1FR]PJN58762.1 hypothetical protein PAEAM_34130 [Paenibacillus sp. GM1FR]